MTKTKPTYRETTLWILSIEEIEGIIFNNVIQVKSYIFRNYKNMDFNISSLIHMHKLVSWNLFEEAWQYRKHNVTMWDFQPIDYYKVIVEMKKLEDDISYRYNIVKTVEEKKEFLAYIMWKILWIHPFFDYNGRVTRLFWELFLLKNKLALSKFYNTSRNDFVKAMKKATQIWEFDDTINLI